MFSRPYDRMNAHKVSLFFQFTHTFQIKQSTQYDDI